MQIKSIDGLLEALGGYSNVSRLCGVSKHASAMWRLRGQLPARTFPTLTGELAKRGHTASLALWGMELPRGMSLSVKVNGKARS